MRRQCAGPIKRFNTVQHIRVISLDLDDTLWDVEPVIRRAEAALWSYLANGYPRIAEQFSRRRLLELRIAICDEFPDRAHDFRFLREAVLSRVAADAGYSDELVEPAFAVFDAERNNVDLYPDVLEVLEWLNAHFVVAAATNGNADLHRIGIGHYFDHIVTSVAAGAAKPDAAVFDRVSELAGFEHERVLHVGDHPETDVDGARRSGMESVWMNRGRHPWTATDYRPDHEVADMAELQAMLEPYASRRR